MIAEEEPKLDIVQLTTRQRLFVDYYVSSFNASEAARQAGYKGKYINRLASQMLGKPAIKEEIQRRVGPKLAEDPTISPTTIKRGVFSTIEECKVPKDKFVGYELLGRMTPGTFEPAPATTVNIFSVMGDIASKLSALNIDVASTQPATPALPSLPAHPPVHSITPSLVSASSDELPTSDDVSTISTASDGVATPQGVGVCNNTDTPKIVSQIP